MSTFGYDFSEAEEMGDFVTLTPGRYIFALQSVEKGESASGNPKAVIRLRVVAGNDAYIGGVITQHWPVTGKGAFRFRAMLKAFGVNFKDKGKINLGKYVDEEFGARVTLTEGNELNEAGEKVWFHELNAILPAEQYADLLDDEDLEEDDEEEDDFEDEEEDIEEEDEDDEEFEEGEEITVEDLEDMNLDELKELAEEWDVSTKPAKGKKKLTQAQMRARLGKVIEEMAEEEEDEPEDEEEEDDDVLTEEDIEEMELSDLKELAEEYEIALPKVPKGKRLTASKVRKVLLAELFPDEDEDEDDEEPF